MKEITATGLIIFLAVAGVFSFTPSSAAQPVLLDEQKEYFSLERRLDVLADNDQKWSIQDVASNYLADRFSRIRSKRPNFGFSRAAYWLRFEVMNKGAEEKRLLLEVGFPLIDHVDLYIPTFSKKYTKKVPVN